MSTNFDADTRFDFGALHYDRNPPGGRVEGAGKVFSILDLLQPSFFAVKDKHTGCVLGMFRIPMPRIRTATFNAKNKNAWKL